MEHNVMISQANALTESRYDFNRTEKNALYKIIEKVRHDYIEHPNTKTIEGFDNLKVSLPASVLGDITDIRHKDDAHKALVALRKRDVEIRYEDGSWVNTGFVNYCKYDAKSDTYEVEVSSEIMPHLVELARQYTTYSLTVAMALKSIYSQRFYELCCQYKNYLEKGGIAGFHKTQDQLRQMLCLENKYEQNQDFNRKVVLRAQEEIKAMYDAGSCDLFFEVQIKGRGRAQSYDFHVMTRQLQEQQRLVIEEARKQWLYIRKRLQASYPRDPKFVERVSHAIELEAASLIRPVFDKIQKLESEYKGTDLARIIRYVLKADFGLF